MRVSHVVYSVIALVSASEVLNPAQVSGADAKPAVLLIINRQPNANIIETVDSIRSLLPQFAAEMPGSVRLSVVVDRTPPIRRSLHDVEMSLLISGVLVILVVFWFLRNVRATLIPAVAVTVSIVGTFGVMYLCGYSLDNLSLMALTISTGFVVDDAIVVVENVTRYREMGETPLQAALSGTREIAFTVLSMSVSLVAVFIPILLMGGMVGRLVPLPVNNDRDRTHEQCHPQQLPHACLPNVNVIMVCAGV